MRRSRLVLPVVLLAALLPGAALAHVRATSSQRQAVLAAVVHQRQLSQPQANCQVVTISTVNRDYAEVSWPKTLSSACLKVAANGVIIEHLDQKTWRFVTAGSSFTCPVKGLPNAVSKDLGVCR